MSTGLIIFACIATYVAIAFMTGFFVLVRTKIERWSSYSDPEFASILAGVFWPIGLPIFVLKYTFQALDRKATEVANKYI